MKNRSRSQAKVKSWRQVRLTPEEDAAIAEIARLYGVQRSAALRLVIRKGLDLPTPLKPQ
jgi:hypothetical protein